MRVASRNIRHKLESARNPSGTWIDTEHSAPRSISKHLLIDRSVEIRHEKLISRAQSQSRLPVT